jgi:hypothetical protein
MAWPRAFQCIFEKLSALIKKQHTYYHQCETLDEQYGVA